MDKALGGLVVLDLSTEVAGPYCTKLLSGFGAEVIKVEAPGEGDPVRRIGPYQGDDPHLENSVLFLYLNTGKKSVTLDLKSTEGARAFKQLARHADAVVESFEPGHLDSLGLGYDSLRAANPALVITSVTPFGQSGPYRNYKATSIVDYAVSGHLYITGSPEREPLQSGSYASEYAAGLHAVIATMAALWAREKVGVGQHVDVSIVECMAAMHQWSDVLYTHNGVIKKRGGNRHPESYHPMGFFPCKDGLFVLGALAPAKWEALCAMVGRPEIAGDPRFATAAHRFDHADEMDALLVPWFLQHTADQIMRSGQEYRILCTKVLSVDEVLDDPHFMARGFWQEVDHPIVGPATYPGAPFRLAETPWQAGRAPLLGEHNREVLGGQLRLAEDDLASSGPAGGAVMGSQLPLSGVRILDLTRGWAGPLGTRILGDLGAQVIKIENSTARGVVQMTPSLKEKLAHWRWGDLPPPEVRGAIYPQAQPGERPWLRQGTYNKMNRNKLGVTLDLTNAEGVATFKRLVALSDAVIENYTPRVMGNFGLGYPTLESINPSIIMVSMPGFGVTGPYRDYASLGPNLEGASGLASLTGYEGGVPMKLGVAYPDPIGGLNAVPALLFALWHRRRTGRGQFIEVSQCEALMALMGEVFLDYTMNRRVARPRGNSHPNYAPHGVYRCRGEDSWVAIAVRSDEEWRSLCQAIGQPAWSANARFASPAGRREHGREMDELLESWTRERDHREVMALLQSAGVPAGAALTNKEMLEDPHYRERGFYVTIDQPDVGPSPYDGLPMKFSGVSEYVWEPAPGLGQHNHGVLADLLGMQAQDLQALVASGVISDQPPI